MGPSANVSYRLRDHAPTASTNQIELFVRYGASEATLVRPDRTRFRPRDVVVFLEPDGETVPLEPIEDRTRRSA